MSANGWLQFVIFCLILLASVRPVGLYLARVLEGQRTWLDPVLRLSMGRISSLMAAIPNLWAFFLGTLIKATVRSASF